MGSVDARVAANPAQACDLAAQANLLQAKVSADLGVNWGDIEEYVVRTDINVADKHQVSKLYLYHGYYGYEWVYFKWLKNELNLIPGVDMQFEYGGNTYLKVRPGACK